MGKYGMCVTPDCSRARGKGLRGFCSPCYCERLFDLPENASPLDAGEVAMTERVQRLGFLGALQWAEDEARR